MTQDSFTDMLHRAYNEYELFVEQMFYMNFVYFCIKPFIDIKIDMYNYPSVFGEEGNYEHLW